MQVRAAGRAMGDCLFRRWCDGGCVRRAATTVGSGRAAMEDDGCRVWQLRSGLERKREKERLRLRFVLGKR